MKKCRAREKRERNECSESIWIRLKWWAELLTFHLLHHKLDSTFVCIKNNGAVLIKSIKLLKLSLLPLIFIATGWYYSSFFTVNVSQYLSQIGKTFPLPQLQILQTKLSLQRLYFILQQETETELFICWEGDTIFFYMVWYHSLLSHWPQRSGCLKYFNARLFVN